LSLIQGVLVEMNKQKKSDITKGREVADIGFDGLVGLFE